MYNGKELSWQFSVIPQRTSAMLIVWETGSSELSRGKGGREKGGSGWGIGLRSQFHISQVLKESIV